MKKEYTIKCEPVTPGWYKEAIWQKEILDEKFNVIQERKIIKESEYVVTGPPKIKYNIYYSDMDQPEFYTEDLEKPQVPIREGYVKSEESL